MSYRVDSDSKSNDAVRSMSGAVIVGSGWAILIRWISRFLGIISLAICARILTPADYGLVSMAMVVIGFSIILVEFGIDASLIRSQSPPDSVYDTAWSLRIIQSAIVLLITFATAPLAAYFYHDPRVISIMMVIGLAGFVGGIQNIYVVNYRKTLNFRADFVFSIIPKFVSFASAIAAVLFFKSYWGLVVGICANEISRTVVSYIMIPKRPKWSLSDWRDLTAFSGWYFLRGLAVFLTSESDKFVVGTLAGPQQTGLYSVGREVSALPSTEIVAPIGRALFPALSKLGNDPARLRAGIEKSITATLIITAPFCFAFSLVSYEFILLVFGAQWTSAAELVSVFCFGAVLSGFRDSAANAFVVLGKLKSNAALAWMHALVVLGLFLPVFNNFGLLGIAWLYVVSGLMVFAAYAILLHRNQLTSGCRFWFGVARPLLSAVLMFLIAEALVSRFPETSPILALALKSVLCCVFYPLILLLLWTLMGRPVSSEGVLVLIAKQTALLAVEKSLARLRVVRKRQGKDEDA